MDAEALGNHDLAPGAGRLAALRGAWVRFPLLAANLANELRKGSSRGRRFSNGSGLRVAVVGLGHSPDRPPDVPDCAAVTQRRSTRRGPRGTWSSSSRTSGSDLDVALVPLTTGIDVVLGGHTHDVLSPPDTVLDCGAALARVRGCRPRPVLVVHSGAYGQYLGRVDVDVSDDPDGSGAMVVRISRAPWSASRLDARADQRFAPGARGRRATLLEPVPSRAR